MLSRMALVAGLLVLASPLTGLAQSQPPSSLALKDPTACKGAATSAPATTPAPKATDGTAPGNSGSTGWSGGTGGAFIGTTQNGSTAESKTYQPATASGLDLKGVKAKPANC